MTAEHAFDTPNYAATSAELERQQAVSAAPEPEPSRPYMCVGFRAAAKFDGHVTRFNDGTAAAVLQMFEGYLDGSVQFYSSAHLRELADVAGRLAAELDAAEASQ